ncbi:cadherin-13-like [Lampetra fluviatilis]
MSRRVTTLLVTLQICHVIESLAPYAPPRCLQGSADPSDRLGCEWAAPFNARRSRRAIFAPELLVSENQRPPFPRRIGKVWRSSNAEDGHRFTLSASGSIEDPTRTFSIDATSGDVYVLRALDRERNATHQLTVSVMNRSGDVVEGPTVMLVHVLDQNDNRPRFQHEPFHAQLPEHAPRGHHVIHVEADDPDNAETGNAELRYSLGPPRPPPANRSAVSFAIDPLRGDITTTSDPQLLDREALATLTYELVVSVSDMAGGDSGLVRSSTVTVTIADINDNPPVFHPTTRFEVSVEENVVRPLLNLTVRDVDERGSANWEVSFSIISGDTDGTFNVSTRPHSNRGILGLAQPLDYETWRVHALLVRADNLAPLVPHVRLPHASTATIVVSVLDTNEAPVFHHGPNSTVVAHQPEGLQPGAVVARLNASDPDLAQQQTVRYSVLSDPARWLRVEALSGVVTHHRGARPRVGAREPRPRLRGHVPRHRQWPPAGVIHGHAVAASLRRERPRARGDAGVGVRVRGARSARQPLPRHPRRLRPPRPPGQRGALHLPAGPPRAEPGARTAPARTPRGAHRGGETAPKLAARRHQRDARRPGVAPRGGPGRAPRARQRGRLGPPPADHAARLQRLRVLLLTPGPLGRHGAAPRLQLGGPGRTTAEAPRRGGRSGGGARRDRPPRPGRVVTGRWVPKLRVAAQFRRKSKTS